MGVSSDADASGSPLDRLLMTFLIVVGLLTLSFRFEQTTKLLWRNKWVVALFILILSSIIWSNFPGISLRRSIRSAGALIMVLVVLTESSPEPPWLRF